MKKQTLSLVVSAYNEEKKIADCLSSANGLADEIIVVDCSSLDTTGVIAKKYTKHIFVRPNNKMLNSNKNFGFSKATSDWILCLDADERVTPELKEEIIGMLTNSQSLSNGYWIPRKNIIFGKWMQHAGWYPDNQLRLFRRGKGKFAEKHVHEMIEIEGETSTLQEHILHYNYDTVSQFLQKLDGIYAPNEAEQLLAKGYTFVWTDAIRMPAKEFLSRFFARQGYKDGLHGLMLSLLMAFYHLIVFAKIWEKEKFTQITDDTFLDQVEEEVQKTNKEFRYWFQQEKLNQASSHIQKLWLRIKHILPKSA